MRRRRGFSVTELIYCVAIVTIVAAILTPVFRSAKHAAQVTSSLSNLRQIYTALMLYQNAEGSTAQSGTLSQMGLPTGEQYNALNVPAPVWKSPCTRNPNWCATPIAIEYEYFAATSVTPWEDAVAKFHDNSIVFVDMNCAEHSEPLLSDFIDHQALGVQFSGTILKLRRSGNYHLQDWWLGPDPNPS